MKKIITYLLIIIPAQFFYANSLFSQSVAINIDGSVAHSSAILDVKSITKGILAPRMTSVQRIAIITPAAGLLVYDTDTNSFWFYNGTTWGNLSATGATGWLLNGNSGTNPSTNFIGTSDLQPLRFKVNNLWAGEIHPTTLNTFSGIHSGESNTTGYSNSGFGISALKSNILGYENTAHGAYSLANNTTASRNTAIGTNSLFTQSFSNGGASWESGNVAVGYNSLYLNQSFNLLSGIHNTAIGTYALQGNTYGAYNTALGYGSLVSNSIGNYNTAVGVNSLFSNTQGTLNTAVGNWALYSNTLGYQNSAYGIEALYSNTTGNLNTANGLEALYKNTMGNENTSIGAQSLSNNSSASRNTAVGNNALFTQSYDAGTSWESGNVAVGYNALYLNQPVSPTNGIKNTAVGSFALQGNTNGYNNTAVGYVSLVSNTTGIWNTALGTNSLYSNLTGNSNNAIGAYSLYHNQYGSENNAFGRNALGSVTSGLDNTAIGDGALISLTEGSINIGIGAGSGVSPAAPGVNNTISIGNFDILAAVSNETLIGNTSMSWIGGQVGWFNYSDARIKTNIKEEVRGLDFVMRLRPVTYNKNLQKMREITGNKESKDFSGKYDIEKIKFSGFLAQEVEKAAKESGYDFDGVHKPQNDHELYSLSYSEFVVPLVKAVQEQQAMIKTQQQQIDMLIKRIEALEKK